MEPPANVFRQQQPWVHNNFPPDNKEKLVAYRNCDHSYNNLGFTLPSTSTSMNFNESYKTINSNDCQFIVSASPTSKKNSNQKFGQWPAIKQRSKLVSIKSKIGVEYRRYSILRSDIIKFDELFKRVESIHQLQGTLFVIYYSDQDGDLLPINNDDNLAKAIETTARLKTTHYIVPINNNTHFDSTQNSHQIHLNNQHQQLIQERPYLKLFLEKKGIPNGLYCSPNFNSKCKRKDNLINMLIPSSVNSSPDTRLRIGMPEDFRQISSIIDADILPATRRRVVLKRGGSDKPLGFYIRDGTYHKMNSDGIVERNYGIFISRLVPGGLAESTNLLAENDEILEVNGIEVGRNKRLDQVRDMMVANSSNLIITTRPAKPFSHCNATHYNRLRNKHSGNSVGRDRISSTNSDLGEDFIRNHIY